jgi:hypothetical protein
VRGQTLAQTKASIDLFIKSVADRPMHTYGGADAQVYWNALRLTSPRWRHGAHTDRRCEGARQALGGCTIRWWHCRACALTRCVDRRKHTPCRA